MREAKLIVISGPSGSGKTSVIKMLMEKSPGSYELVKSVTTRQSRGAGDFYFHVSPAEFETFPGGFLETNVYSGNQERYGTPKAEVDRILSGGKTPILDVDIHGYRQIRDQKVALGTAIVSAFIITSPQNLHSRLISRSTDSETAINERLKTACHEVMAAAEYNSVILNDDLETAVSELKNAIECGVFPSYSFSVEEYQNEMKLLIEKWLPR